MKKQIYTVSNFRKTLGRFKRLYLRISNMMSDGSFYELKLYERNNLIRKIKMLLKRLEQFKLKTGLKVAGAALSLTLLANTAFSQPFVEKTGSDNPFNLSESPFIGLLRGVPNQINVKIPSLVDIDNDGDLDLFSGSFSNAYDKKDFNWFKNKKGFKKNTDRFKGKSDNPFSIEMFINEGTAEEPLFEKVEPTNSPFDTLNFSYIYYTQPVFADLDGDGDYDLSLAKYNDYNDPIKYFENTGDVENPEFTELTGSDNPFYGTYIYALRNIEFADIDADGDLDLIVSTDNEIQFFENQGDQSNPDFVYVSDSPFSGIYVDEIETELVDIDADGDLDLFVLGDYGGGTAKLDFVRFFENTGSASAPEFQETSSPFDEFNGYAAWAYSEFADIDNDGDFDAVFDQITYLTYFYGADPLHYYKNIGTESEAEFEYMSQNLVSYIPRPELADIDNDGDLDMAVGGMDTLLFLENQGDIEHPEFAVVEGSDSPFNSISLSGYGFNPEFADLDNDGDLDLVVSYDSYYDTIAYFQNIGDAQNPNFEAATSNPFSYVYGSSSFGIDFNLTDIDADGDLDLFVSSQTYGDVTFMLWRNVGDAQNPAFTVDSCGNPFNGIELGMIFSSDMADFDNDGDVDFIVGSYDEYLDNFGVKYYDNAGSASNPLFDEFIGNNNPFLTANQQNILAPFPTIADLDNDGDNDLIAGEYFGNIRYFVNEFVPSVKVDEIKSEISVYPNPSDAQFFINMSGIKNLQVWNISGKLVLSRNINADNYMLDLSNNSKGLYLLKIQTDAGEFNHKLLLK